MTLDLQKSHDLIPLQDHSFISKEWLKHLFEKYYKKVLEVNFQCSTTDTKEGFLSEIAYIDLYLIVSDGDDGNTKRKRVQESLVFKFDPIDTSKQEFMRKGCLRQREVDFYEFANSEEFKKVRSSAALINVLPQSLCALINDSCLTIVMRDLKSLGYKTAIPIDGSSLTHTKLVCASMAVIHAAGLYYFKLHGKHPIKQYKDASFYEMLLAPNLVTLTDIFKTDVDLFGCFSRLQNLTKEIILTLSQNVFIETVIHGDLWAGQCMISPGEDEACILDWQFATIGNPVIDLMSMFLMSTDPEVLENDLEEILSHYWTVLTSCLEKQQITLNESYCQFKENLEKNWMIGFFVLTASLHDFLGTVISDKRLQGLMKFLHRKNVFSNFLKEHEIAATES